MHSRWNNICKAMKWERTEAGGSGMSVGRSGWHGESWGTQGEEEGAGGGEKEELGLGRPLSGIPFLGSGFTSWHWRTSL